MTRRILYEVYNVLPPAKILAGGAAVAPDPPIRKDPPSYQEAKSVFSELKGPSCWGLWGPTSSCLKLVERA